MFSFHSFCFLLTPSIFIRADSVSCAMCKKISHLGCLDPPLHVKPKNGYSWVCATCSKQHTDQVEEYMATGIKTKVASKPTLQPKQKAGVKLMGKGKGREGTFNILPFSLPVTNEPLLQRIVTYTPHRKEMRTMNGWPYRYFGVNTDTFSILGKSASFDGDSFPL